MWLHGRALAQHSQGPDLIHSSVDLPETGAVALVSKLEHSRPLTLSLQDITPLQVVLPNTALHLKALLDFEDKNGDKVMAGDEWLFEGPGEFWAHLFVFVWAGASCPSPITLTSLTMSISCLLLSFPRHLHPTEGGGSRGDHSGHSHQTEPSSAAQGPQGML